MISISETVKRLRKQAGMTQEELAVLCYVKRTTIVNVELQNAEPSVLLLQRIADVFGCELAFVAKDGSVALEKQNAEYLAAIRQAKQEIERLSAFLAEVAP